MSDEEFNALCENIQEVGMVGAVQVVENNDRYMIIGGEHRWRAAKVLGHRTIKCDIFDREKFDEDRQKFQTVRLNVIHGKFSPLKFLELVKDLKQRYSEDVIKEMMKFTDDDAFQKLIGEIKEALPPELAERLEKSKEEIKTIEDLSLILNTLFTKYGSDLKYSFMFFTWGGKEHIMVRCSKELKKRVWHIAQYCREKELDINEVFELLLNETHCKDGLTVISQRFYEKEG